MVLNVENIMMRQNIQPYPRAKLYNKAIKTPCVSPVQPFHSDRFRHALSPHHHKLFPKEKRKKKV